MCWSYCIASELACVASADLAQRACSAGVAVRACCAAAARAAGALTPRPCGAPAGGPRRAGPPGRAVHELRVAGTAAALARAGRRRGGGAAVSAARPRRVCGSVGMHTIHGSEASFAVASASSALIRGGDSHITLVTGTFCPLPPSVALICAPCARPRRVPCWAARPAPPRRRLWRRTCAHCLSRRHCVGFSSEERGESVRPRARAHWPYSLRPCVSVSSSSRRIPHTT